mmetsp:Transcript_18781/g.31306  ORF Transcript_18781/g.31306 Transcript_18781/m.31306 type:complete len:227 (+) Transcript_18781:82-762(+)
MVQFFVCAVLWPTSIHVVWPKPMDGEALIPNFIELHFATPRVALFQEAGRRLPEHRQEVEEVVPGRRRRHSCWVALRPHQRRARGSGGGAAAAPGHRLPGCGKRSDVDSVRAAVLRQRGGRAGRRRAVPAQAPEDLREVLAAALEGSPPLAAVRRLKRRPRHGGAPRRRRHQAGGAQPLRGRQRGREVVALAQPGAGAVLVPLMLPEVIISAALGVICLYVRPHGQ